MTTLSIPLDDAVARKLEAQSAEVGKTPEEYAREVLGRVTGLPSLRALAERNAERLRAMGYQSEEEVEEMIRKEIEEVRRSR